MFSADEDRCNRLCRLWVAFAVYVKVRLKSGSESRNAKQAKEDKRRGEVRKVRQGHDGCQKER